MVYQLALYTRYTVWYTSVVYLVLYSGKSCKMLPGIPGNRYINVCIVTIVVIIQYGRLPIDTLYCHHSTQG